MLHKFVERYCDQQCCWSSKRGKAGITWFQNEGCHCSCGTGEGMLATLRREYLYTPFSSCNYICIKIYFKIFSHLRGCDAQVSFAEEALRENVGAFVNALLLAKPAGLKKSKLPTLLVFALYFLCAHLPALLFSPFFFNIVLPFSSSSPSLSL